MGRAPCCDKANVKRGPWSPEEDGKLKAYIEQNGTGGNWIALPQKIGLKRCGKSCRLRWLNYLRPNIKHGGFSDEEDNIICTLYMSIGSRWSIIAAQLPGRTDNDIKNYWNTRLKKKLLGKQRKEQAAARRAKQEMKTESDNFMSPMATNTYPYWAPELPVAVSVMNPPNQVHHPKDQASIKNLLVKLGERFFNDQNNTATNFQYPFDYISSTQHHLFENSINIPMNSINSTACSQLPPTHDVVSGETVNNFQGLFNNYATEDIIYSTNTQQLDGFESFCGVDNIVKGSSSSEESTWGDISSLVCPAPLPPMVSADYDQMLENCAFVESGGYVMGLQ